MLGSVGMKIFFFFWKNCRVGTKNRVGRVSGNTGISVSGLIKIVISKLKIGLDKTLTWMDGCIMVLRPFQQYFSHFETT